MHSTKPHGPKRDLDLGSLVKRALLWFFGLWLIIAGIAVSVSYFFDAS